VGPGLDLTQSAELAALLGIAGILVHSLVDFNLPIPANDATFYVAVAIAAAASFQTSRRRRQRSADCRTVSVQTASPRNLEEWLSPGWYDHKPWTGLLVQCLKCTTVLFTFLHETSH